MTYNEMLVLNILQISRPDMNQLKLKYDRAKNKSFYITTQGKYPIDMILEILFTNYKTKTEKFTRGTFETLSMRELLLG